MKQMAIRVWACAEEGCRNYYGSSSQDTLNLTEETNLESDMRHTAATDGYRSQIVGNRGECPDCRNRGKRVQRVLVEAVIKVNPAAVPVPSPAATAGNLRPAA